MTEPRTTSPLRGATSTGRSATAAAALIGVSTLTMAERVAKVIEVIRPAIQVDNVDIELREVDAETGIVTVELLSAGVTCPISAATLNDGIERIMKSRVDGVTAVRQQLAAGRNIDTGTFVSL